MAGDGLALKKKQIQRARKEEVAGSDTCTWVERAGKGNSAGCVQRPCRKIETRAQLVRCKP